MTLREKCPDTNIGKYGPERTPYLDTFHAVWSSVTLLKMNPRTFTFKGILYRVKTYSWYSKTFGSACYPEFFSMDDSGSSL